MIYVGWALVPDVPFHYNFFTDGREWVIVQCEISGYPEIITPDEMITWDFPTTNGSIPPFCKSAHYGHHRINPTPIDEWLENQRASPALAEKNRRDYQKRLDKYHAIQNVPPSPPMPEESEIEKYERHLQFYLDHLDWLYESPLMELLPEFQRQQIVDWERAIERFQARFKPAQEPQPQQLELFTA